MYLFNVNYFVKYFEFVWRMCLFVNVILIVGTWCRKTRLWNHLFCVAAQKMIVVVKLCGANRKKPLICYMYRYEQNKRCCLKVPLSHVVWQWDQQTTEKVHWANEVDQKRGMSRSCRLAEQSLRMEKGNKQTCLCQPECGTLCIYISGF